MAVCQRDAHLTYNLANCQCDMGTITKYLVRELCDIKSQSDCDWALPSTHIKKRIQGLVMTAVFAGTYSGSLDELVKRE